MFNRGTQLALYCGLLFAAPAMAADLTDLSVVDSWQELAHGVWRAQLGDLTSATRYTDLAAAAPRLNQINRLFAASTFPASFEQRRIRFRVTADHKTVVHIPLAKDERIYGFGLQFDRTQRNKQILDLRVDHFNKGNGATHAPVPFFVSSRGYGLFINTARFLKVYTNVGNRKDSPNNPPPVDRNPPTDEPQPGPWLAQPSSDAMELYLHGDGVELIMFGADGADVGSTQDEQTAARRSTQLLSRRSNQLQNVVARYNLYCGGGAMPPLWGLGFWHRVPSKFSSAETEQEIADFETHKIPLDVIGLEPGWQTKSYPCTFEWQRKRFPDPPAFVRSLLDRGIRLNLWENPYVAPQARIYKSLYPLSGSHMVWLGIVPDYTLPDARQILVDQHRRDHVDIGISGYKIDEVDGYDRWLWPDHATFPSGVSAETMRQTYGMLMQKMLYQQLFRKSDRRTYGLVRASNGAASAYPFVIYSDSYGHAQYITGLSSASLGGILWCPEIRSAGSSREWLNRMHTVCFSPMAMLNAWASGLKPWSFPDVTDKVRETIELRMRLLPYLYTAFADYHQTGIPPVRSLLLEPGAVSEDAVVDDTLFMFGPDILVAPFFEKTDVQRNVSLPAGKWYDFYSGKQIAEGPASITVSAEQTSDRIPLFVKDGSVIPMLSAAVDNTEKAYGQPLTIRHYGTKAGSCQLYEDDGKTFAFERGEFSIRRFSIDADRKFTETKEFARGPAMFGEVESVESMSAAN